MIRIGRIMKRPILLPALFSAALPAALLVASPAIAQVTTNEDALPKAAPAAKPATHATSHQNTRNQHTASKTKAAPPPAKSEHTTAQSAASAPHQSAAQRVGTAPTVPSAPPPPVVIPPPPVKVPLHPPVPPTEVKPVADAKGSIQPRDNGVRILFAPESADFNADMLQTLQDQASKLAKQPYLRITLLSYAEGKPDDVSTPRRIALARALNVRSVLIRAGVATTRIYPRAIGIPPKDDNPPERLDLVAEGAVPVPTSQAQYGVDSSKAAR